MNIQEISQLIKKRRSIYPPVYNNTPIDKETIELLLENANWAPNHKKTEPWRWKVFHSETARKKLSDYMKEHYTRNTPKEKFSERKLQTLAEKALKSQAVIAICMYNDPEITIPEWEEVAAVSCAVQNIWLSCTALGIGAYWSSPRSATDAGEFLTLDENEKCLGWFFMGYTDQPVTYGKRQEAATKTTWIKP